MGKFDLRVRWGKWTGCRSGRFTYRERERYVGQKVSMEVMAKRNILTLPGREPWSFRTYSAILLRYLDLIMMII